MPDALLPAAYALLLAILATWLALLPHTYGRPHP